jgi:hypothetical protein
MRFPAKTRPELRDENWYLAHVLDNKIPKFSGEEGYGRYIDL